MKPPIDEFDQNFELQRIETEGSLGNYFREHDDILFYSLRDLIEKSSIILQGSLRTNYILFNIEY